MKIRIKFFAALREIVGQEEVQKDVSEGTTTGGLLETMASEFPKLRSYTKATQVAVNHEIVDLKHIVKSEDEVAFLPPVSGG